MAAEKNALSGNTAMLLLKLLEGGDMYGYQMIEELSRRSRELFRLKTGTLYPILHALERDGMVASYDAGTEGKRVRRYYRITGGGRDMLRKKREEWQTYARAVRGVMEGGTGYVLGG